MTKRERGLSVSVPENDKNGVEKALRKLKRKVTSDNRLREIKERETYTKPSERKQRARAAAIKRHQRDLAKSTLKKPKSY